MEHSTAQQDLEYIKRIIQDSRRAIVDNGLIYVSWGILCVLALIATYFAGRTNRAQYIPWIWIAFVAIGYSWAFMIIGRHKKKAAVYSFPEKVLANLWIACGAGIMILAFAGIPSGGIIWWAIYPVISIILGIGYFVTGEVYGSKWLRILAILWWLGALVMLYVQGWQNILIVAGMVIMLQIIPGIIIYKQWKSQLGVKQVFQKQIK